MNQYYQGEDIPFSFSFSGEFQSAVSFLMFSEIRAYAYTDGCLIQEFSIAGKSGYEKLMLNGNKLSGIIKSEYSSRFSPGAIIIEVVGIKQNPDNMYDIGKQTIGSLMKSFIKAEKLLPGDNIMIPVYYGNNSNATINVSQMQLLNLALKSEFSGSYSFTGGNYKYLCIPELFGYPAQFIDQVTNFNVPVIQQNGKITVENPNGLNRDYNVWRSYYKLTNALTIKLS